MASNGKWVNPAPSQVDKGTGLALQSLTSYLGGWQEWSGAFDLSFGGAGYTLGNSSKFFDYKLEGDMCDFHFDYTVGNVGTAFPAFNLGILLPFPVAPCSTSGNLVWLDGVAQAVDTSTGLSATARMYAVVRAQRCEFFGGQSFHPAANGAMEGTWTQTVGAEWPFVTGAGAKSPWAVGDGLRGTGRYRIQV